ncbi:MAG: hypothetical protein ACFB50_19270 [Rubrobacteraceae bacterium]
MDRFLLRQFQREVERQCRFAIMAFEDIETSRAMGSGRRFWFSIQNLLVALGRISRLLWPPEDSHSGRGRELRESLEAPADFPLRNREIVEYFEQFEERLENWYETSGSHRFFDSYTEPLDVLATTTQGDRFRGFDTENEAILFHGEMYRLQPLAEAVETLLDKAERETQKPRYYPPDVAEHS